MYKTSKAGVLYKYQKISSIKICNMLYAINKSLYLCTKFVHLENSLYLCM